MVRSGALTRQHLPCARCPGHHSLARPRGIASGKAMGATAEQEPGTQWGGWFPPYAAEARRNPRQNLPLFLSVFALHSCWCRSSTCLVMGSGKR